MVKVIKTISLDYELIEKLNKTGNGSGLINDLVKEHFLKVDNPFKDMNKEQLKQFIAIEEIKEDAIAKMKEIDPNATI